MARLTAEFLHAVSAMGVFCALGMEALALYQDQRAVNAAQAEVALNSFRAAHRITPLAGAATILTGGYLTQTVWGWRAGWISTSLACVIIVALISATTATRQAAQMGARQVQEGVRLSPSFTIRAGLLVAILFLMTVKPPLAVSLLAVTTAATGGWLVGKRPIKKSDRADPETERDETVSSVPSERSAVPELTQRTLSWWLVVLIAGGIIFIGARFLVVPLSAAAAFGVPAEGGASVAYLWAKGSRDIVSGVLLLALLWTRASRRVVAAFIGAAALIPLADFMNVYANAVPHNPLALGIHGGTAFGMVALAARLTVRERRTN